MSPQPRRPVSRWKVALGALAMAGALAAVMALTDALRYPHVPVGHGEEEPAPAGDPRDPIECDDPLPREGQPRISDPENLDVVQRVSSGDLYDCPESFDGAQVRFRGEVVGAVLRRDEGAWVHLNDDIYSGAPGPLPGHRFYRGGNAGVGVFIPHELADRIAVVGGPRTTGDVIEVVGIFHRVDPVTRDIAVIRASIGTTDAGSDFSRPELPARPYVAGLLAAVMLIVVVAERRATRDRL